MPKKDSFLCFSTGNFDPDYSSFDYSKAREEPPLTEAGVVSAEAHWERIRCILERVMQYKVKLACHPHEPPMPRGKGFRGVERVMGTVEGLKRFIEIRPSPYHGLNFCQGTVCEMLENPAREIFDVIRYFGSRKEAGYDGMIMPDHAPRIAGDQGGR